MDFQYWQYNAAIALATLLCVVSMTIHVRNNHALNKNGKKWLYHITVAMSLCIIASCVGCYLDENPHPPIFNTVAALVELTISPFISVFLCGAYGLRRPLRIGLGVALGNVVFQLGAAPFGLVFQILPDGSYVRGDFYFMQVAVVAISIIFALYGAVRFSRRFRNRDLVTLAIIVATASIGIITQGLNTNFKCIYLCITLAMLLFYIYGDDLIQQSLLERIREQVEQYARTQHRIIMGLAEIIEVRDENTGQHITRAAEYVRILALEARRSGYHTDALTEDYIEMMTQCSFLHDVGKIAIPDAILNKPGRLTDEEFAVIKTHATQGGRIVENIMGDATNSDYLTCGKQIATFHHEKWDGSGYPSGLAGEAIPLCARIMAVADVYDALTAERVYKSAMEPEQALAIIEDGAGTHFDPELVRLFIASKDKICVVANAEPLEAPASYKFNLA